MTRRLSSSSSGRRPPKGNRRRTTTRQRKQQHLLDVTVRSRKATQRRNRFFTRIFFTAVVIAGVIGGSWWGGRQLLSRFLWENDDYRLTEIDALTDGALSRDFILSTAGLRVGENIFTVSLSQARENLEALPQVAFVEMTRTLPNHVTIKIEERRPVAWVVESDRVDPVTSPEAFLIDDRGILFQSRIRTANELHLPLICGVNPDELAPGSPVRTAELVAALNLLRLQIKEPRFLVQKIEVSKGYCLLASDRNGATIVFGLDNLGFQLNRLGLIFDHLDAARQEIQTVNLMVERNVPVTFMTPPAAEADLDSAETARGSKTEKTEKKSPAKITPPARFIPTRPIPSRRPEPPVRKAIPIE